MISSDYYAIMFTTMAIFLLCPKGRMAIPARFLMLLALGLAIGIAVGGKNIAMIVRGISGDISIVAFFWLSCAVAKQLATNVSLVSHRQLRFAAASVCIGALLLYPASLGLSQWDPYRLGYGMMLPVLCVLAVIGMSLLGQRFSAMAISLALCAYALRLLESENLWDYLLDPWLVFYCIYFLLARRRDQQAD